MAAVRFNLRSKKAKQSSILLKYRVNGKVLTYPTGESVPVKMWNDNKMRAYQKVDILLANQVNLSLDNIEIKLKEAINDIHRRGDLPTVDLLRKELDIKLGRVQKERTPTFGEYIQEFIARRENDNQYKKESIKVYKAFAKRWKEFSRKKDYKFDELDLNLLLHFLNFMRNHENGYADNTINKMIGTSKTILNDAFERGFLKNAPHKSRKYSHPKKSADNIYLNEDEIQKIANLDYSNDPRKDKIRDLFVIACNTGVRYSDFGQFIQEYCKTIKMDNGEIKHGFEIDTNKTGERVFIPMNTVVRHLWEKYEHHLPKVPSNQKMNEALKEIAKDAGLTQEEKKSTFRNKRADKEKLYRYERVSTHTARRSFATNCYKAGVPIHSIMLITGHRSIDTFMSYISIKKEENAQLMGEHAFFE